MMVLPMKEETFFNENFREIPSAFEFTNFSKNWFTINV